MGVVCPRSGKQPELSKEKFLPLPFCYTWLTFCTRALAQFHTDNKSRATVERGKKMAEGNSKNLGHFSILFHLFILRKKECECQVFFFCWVFFLVEYNKKKNVNNREEIKVCSGAMFWRDIFLIFGRKYCIVWKFSFEVVLCISFFLVEVLVALPTLLSGFRNGVKSIDITLFRIESSPSWEERGS